MLLSLLLSAGRSWRFATPDLLELRCLICQKIVRSYDKSASDGLAPEAKSRCSKHSRDRLCLFIQDVISGLTKAANRSAFCDSIAACPPQMPSNLTGIRCPSCLMLAAHLLMHAPADRPTAFDYFCARGNTMALSLCGELLDGRAQETIDELSKMNSPIGFCQATHFCWDRAEAAAWKKNKAKKTLSSQEL
jgi:hypothetical protein